ncbi:hypothetical protein NIIDNTM18_42870 [Mycolicibacterium litorale]|uniref:Uncharacterized protein n=1 Tax=Mycolicibacterium litorale TaxID=758802 RepID=A0A6S6P9B2_9MYCO|nr:hypothetical protein [Mycolicibacterium litorale]BCI55009.1 hypothetical protein NIIDNTM18_42870 [Mycolicibacterium litorale]
MRADDALKYAAAILKQRISWTTDEIGGSMCDTDHELQLDAISEIVRDIEALAARFGDVNHYSDGRAVKSGAWIEDGAYTEEIWHPVVSEDSTRSWRGHLMSDPEVPCPGIYEVTTDPATQEIHVRVVRIA